MNIDVVPFDKPDKPERRSLEINRLVVEPFHKWLRLSVVKLKRGGKELSVMLTEAIVRSLHTATK